MRALVQATTHPGIGSTQNEDFHLIEPSLGLFAVSDGVSGKNGKLASELACQTILKHLNQHRAEILKYQTDPNYENRCAAKKILTSAIDSANYVLFEKANAGKATQAHWQTAIDIMLLIGEWAMLAHVGNTRTYQWRSGMLSRHFTDHTYAAKYENDGETVEKSKKKLYANELTRGLGLSEVVSYDTKEVKIEPGDVFLLTTHGFHDYCVEKDVTLILANSSIEKMGEALQAHALSKGTKSNITILPIEFRAETGAAKVVPELMQKIEKVRGRSLLRSLSDRELNHILSFMNVLHVEAGKHIVREGEKGDAMFVVIEGEIEISRQGVHIALGKDGELIGDIAAMDGLPRAADVIAKTPTVLLQFPAQRYRDLKSEDPALALKISEGLLIESGARQRRQAPKKS